MNTVEKIPLPYSSFPKPGEEVTWFTGNRMMNGILIGYNLDERPVIINKFNLPEQANSFQILRPKDPFNRIKPNWYRLPKSGRIVKAPKELLDRFNQKLKERIPPGPSYLELITEIYYRGFEVFLVGGTVRDILQDDDSNDIDLITSMPLKSAQPLLRSMFNDKISLSKKTGFIRIGGMPSSGDPFIDLKCFPVYSPGNQSAIFGSDIELDLKLRDFSCNSIYYDPINENLIDPSGRGIDDAQHKNLFLVKDIEAQSPLYHTATIVIRLVKFIGRGYTCGESTITEVKAKYCPLLSTMSVAERVRYIKAQILNKHPKENRTNAYNQFTSDMTDLGFSEEYDRFFRPIEELITIE